MLTKNDLDQIRGIVKEEISVEIKPVKKDVGQIKKTMNEMLDVLDKQDMALLKRVKRLEDHVGISNN